MNQHIPSTPHNITTHPKDTTPTPTPAPPLTGVAGTVVDVAETAVDSAASMEARDWAALVVTGLIILLVLLFGKRIIKLIFRYIAKRTQTEFDDEFIEIILPLGSS